MSRKKITNLVFKVPYVAPKHKEEETNILKYAKIGIKLDRKLYEAFIKANKDIKGVKISRDSVIYIQNNNVVIPFILQDKENYTFQIVVSKPRKLPKYLPELKFDLIQMEGRKILGGQRFIVPVNKYKTIKDKNKK